MCSFVIQHNATDVSSFEAAVAREFHVHFSTISHLRCCFREFGSMNDHTTADHLYGIMWVSYADVNVVNRVPHGGGGVMVWAGISYGQQAQLHFIDDNLKATVMRSGVPLSCDSS
jgi:hypothetical protein